MRILLLTGLILGLARCSNPVLEAPITSANGMAFMVSRDLYGMEQRDPAPNARDRARPPAMECPTEPFEIDS